MLLTVAAGSPLLRATLAAAVLALAACSGKTPESLVASGMSYAAKKDHRAAILEYKSALQLNPKLSEVRLLLAESLLAYGDTSSAILELNKALDEKVPAARVLPTLTKALVLAGDYKRVVSVYGGQKLDDPSAQSAVKVNVSTAWAMLGERAKAEAEAAAALAAAPEFPPALMLKARVLAARNQPDEALAVVDGVLARDSQLHEAWLLRGEILDSGKGDRKGAEAAYRKAVTAEPSYMPAHVAIVSSRLRDNDVAGARAQFALLRKAAPKHPQTVLFDAQLAFLEGKPTQARDELQKLLRAFPDHIGVLVLAGAVEYRLGAVTQAAAHFGKALALNPTLDVARLNLAEVEIRLGQNSKALETLKPLLVATPPRAEALSLAGAAELRLGHPTQAERHFLLAAKLDPSNIGRQTAAAMTRLWVGDGNAALTELQALSAKSADTAADEALFAARMKRGEYDAALAVLDTLSKKRPGNAGHLELRGRVHVERDDLVAARRAFEDALAIDPALTGALIGVVNIDVREDKAEAAVQRLQARIAKDPRNSVALMALAEVKIRQGAPVQEVKQLFVSAVTAAPNDAEPRLRLIAYTLRKNLFKDALSAAQDALAAQPTDTRILQAAGRAQLLAHDEAQAMTTFRRLASAVPDSPQPYMMLAEVHKAAGRNDQAEVAVKKALELDPSLAAAHAALVDLYVNTKRQRAAVEYIDRVKAARPKEPIGYALEAAYHVRLKNTDAAVASLRDGLAKTDSPELALRLFVVLMQAGRAAEADKFGAAWMQRHPKDAAFEYALAVADISRSEFTSAEQRLTRVIAALPNNALALNNMAWVVLKTRGEGALVYARRAVELDPEQPEFMDTLALALAAEKQVSRALELQKRAVELAPTDHRLRLTLAKIAAQAGDKTLARQELNRLQQLGSAFKAQDEVTALLQTL